VGFHRAGIPPQGADGLDRDLRIFLKDRQFEISRTMHTGQRVGAEPQRIEYAAIRVIEEFESAALERRVHILPGDSAGDARASDHQC